MNTDEIRAFLEGTCGHIEHQRDPKLDLLRSLARCEWKGIPTVGIGNDLSTKAQISSVVDAIYWCHVQYPDASVLKFVIGDGDHREEVFEALATLIAARRPDSKPSLKFILDKTLSSLPACPTFEKDDDVKRWMRSIEERLKEQAPTLVRALSAEVRDPSFRWYLGVGASYWSGRVEGLEVCRVYPRKKIGLLRVGRRGKTGKRSEAGEEATRLLEGAPEDFNESDVKLVAEAIGRIAKSRQEGKLRELDYQPEHRYEALILRGQIAIPAGNHSGRALLKPVFGNRPFQFPAKWYTGDKPRYVDILMREGNIPSVVELKYAKGWYGYWRCFRHAIGQAVLYREFIRKTPAVRDLLQRNKGLDASACKALVAFPEPKSSDLDQINQLIELAADFDVEVSTLPIVL